MEVKGDDGQLQELGVEGDDQGPWQTRGLDVRVENLQIQAMDVMEDGSQLQEVGLVGEEGQLQD